ncbi:hypothetical protein [Bacillus sp. FJAT-52991]|uniref:HEAT repeat domain-containing protein n=1 Tax=Bacillus kandeliae TaxID=3129297 RepID=A0ABZ2N8L0_9BACI
MKKMLQDFLVVDADARNEMKNDLMIAVQKKETAEEVVAFFENYLINVRQDIGESGFYRTVSDSELLSEMLEVLYECLNTEINVESIIPEVSSFLCIDKRETDKTKGELYLQYRVTAFLDEVIRMGESLPKEVIDRILASERYYSDKQTEEFVCSIYWRLAERGVDISCKISSLITRLHNRETSVLANNALSALWAAIKGGYFDSVIPNSNKTYRVNLWRLVTTCVGILTSKDDEVLRLGSVGCLIETARTYPETKSLILECMEKWGIKEPKRPRTDVNRDVLVLYSLCKDHPGTTCLPERYQITKKGIMIQ